TGPKKAPRCLENMTPPIKLSFNGLINVELICPPKEVRELVIGELKEHIVGAISRRDVVFRFVGKLRLRDPVVNLTFMAGYSEHFFIKDYNYNKMTLPFDDMSEIIVESKFDRSLFFSMMEQIIAYKLLGKNAVFVHSSGIVHKGEGNIFIGWKGTGKTRILIELLKKGSYLGDDWVILSKKRIFPYFRPIRLYGKEVKDNSSILKKKKVKEKILLNLSLGANRLLEVMPSSFSSKLKAASYSIKKARGLSEKKWLANIPLDAVPKGKKAQIKNVFLLKKTTGAKVAIRKAAFKDVCESIVSSIRYETSTILDYYLMFKFSFPKKNNILFEKSGEIMGKILEGCLSRSDIYVVSLPEEMRIKQIKEEFLDVFFNT
ncbi:hypothetical protein KY358_06230, partial [Candidatus Woesearchaeota archaeon]|nr:hypothetical protein [Candidatus Woesearchaeota archaeon]